MALFRYVIVFSPNAFGQCNQGDTTLLSVEINETSQSNTDTFRQDDNKCVFLNTEGLDVGPVGTSVNVVINAQIDTAAPGNRSFRFFMCSGGRQYNGPVSSPSNNSDGSITLKATYSVSSKVIGGDCVAFLKSKISDDDSSSVKSLSEKEQTKRIIKQILGK